MQSIDDTVCAAYTPQRLVMNQKTRNMPHRVPAEIWIISKSLAAGLKVNWWKVVNPYKKGTMAANCHERRYKHAAFYCDLRMLRQRNFTLTSDKKYLND
jgi:hypothetical protein